MYILSCMHAYVTILPIPVFNYIPFTWPRQLAVTHRQLLCCNALVLVALSHCINAYKHTYTYTYVFSLSHTTQRLVLHLADCISCSRFHNRVVVARSFGLSNCAIHADCLSACFPPVCKPTCNCYNI